MLALVLGISLLPPPEYTGPYEGVLAEIVLPPEEIHAYCEDLLGIKRDKTIRGCAWYGLLDDGVCVIVYPDRTSNGVRPKDIKTHEQAHCKGWRH